MLYDIVHSFTGELMDKIPAASAVDALAEYSQREGFADPREVARDEPEMDFFYLRSDGRLGMVMCNYELHAEPVRLDVPYGVGSAIH
jgi:hypothetical protein